MLSFAFDAEKETPESLKRRRAMLLALQPQFGNADTVGEGIGQALTGAAMGIGQWKANRAEKAGMKAGQDRWSGILGALSGGAQQPSVMPSSAPAATSAPAGGDAIRQGLIQRGLPEHVADAFVMNFQDESGLNPGINEAAPVVPGSRGGFGLSQWTGPRRQALEAFATERGVPASDTDAQLDYLMTELQGPESAAFQKIMASQDTGSAAAAIVNDFLRPAESHRAAREARYLGAGQPAQVASLDPSAGMSPQPAPNPQERIAQALGANNPGNIGMPDGQGGIMQATGDFPPAPSAGGIVPGTLNSSAAGAPHGAGRPGEIRQGSDGRNWQYVETTGMSNATGSQGWIPTSQGGGEPVQTAQSSPTMQQLMEAAGDPWLPESAKPVLKLMIEQELQKSDPVRRMQLEKGQLEIDQLRNPQSDPFTLSPGEIRFGPDGKQIATGGEKQRDLPSAVLEYEYAQTQGFPGTFQDWEASKKGGMSLQVDPETGAVTFQQGANIKPLTEGQSKDTVFATRAEGALPLIDKFGDALTSLPETVGGGVPVIGNYAKSSDFQQAEQAGKEFLQAILRKDTGAAITPAETSEYGSVYLPRPGDSPQLLAQKRVSRMRALEAIKAGMPAQAILMQERALANTNKKAPVVIDGYTIEEVE